MEAVRREQERHVTILHKNIENLQSSMDSAQMAATAKVVNHLTDNQTLLNEVNNLRTEVSLINPCTTFWLLTLSIGTTD